MKRFFVLLIALCISGSLFALDNKYEQYFSFSITPQLEIANGVITLGSNSITPLTSHQDISGKKNVQTAVGDPTASGNAASFIDTISQNTNGEITVTKKNVQSATGSQAGLMSAAHYTKVESIDYASDSDVEAIFA